MLDYIDSAVTRNASEKKINSLLDFMAQAQDAEVLQVNTSGESTSRECVSPARV